MKPHLIMLLLLALPPLFSNILACESAEKSDSTPAPATEKASTAPAKTTATPTATPAASTPAPAKPASKRGTGTPTGIKAWSIM